MKLYLAGPMRGYPKYNFPLFLSEAARLRELGHEVLSPAEMDLAENPETMNIPATEAVANFRKYMTRDLTAVMQVEAVALLPGWQKSTGALTEAFSGHMVGCKLLNAADLSAVDMFRFADAVYTKLFEQAVEERAMYLERRAVANA